MRVRPRLVACSDGITDRCLLYGDGKARRRPEIAPSRLPARANAVVDASDFTDALCVAVDDNETVLVSPCARCWIEAEGDTAARRRMELRAGPRATQSPAETERPRRHGAVSPDANERHWRALQRVFQ